MARTHTAEIDPETIRQAEKTARLSIVEGHVALMPDAHVGIGATVGSVIPTKNAVIPSAVGVDIGCGMVAAELDLTEAQLPDTLEPLLGRIEKAIPAGVGQGHDRVARNVERWLAEHKPAIAFIGHGRETQRVNCHHNFTQREVHAGVEMWITRKGAIKADIDDLGVIPARWARAATSCGARATRRAGCRVRTPEQRRRRAAAMLPASRPEADRFSYKEDDGVSIPELTN